MAEKNSVKVIVTGITGSGKTAVARVIEQALKDAGVNVFVKEPDQVPGSLLPDLVIIDEINIARTIRSFPLATLRAP